MEMEPRKALEIRLKLLLLLLLGGCCCDLVEFVPLTLEGRRGKMSWY